MSEPVTVTVLVENSVNARGLLAEHGLAFHVQVGQRSLLFDTGQSGLVAENARKLGVALDQVEAVALSHGHNDHTGGVRTVSQATPPARFFLHAASLDAKFAGNPDGTSRSIGIDGAIAAAIRNLGEAVTWTTQPTEIMDGVFVTGEILRPNRFEDTGGRFFLDAACTQPDGLLDDQALFFDTSEGVVVLLGCGHSGVVNTLEYVRQLTDSRPIHAVLGGMHLWAASDSRVAQTLAAFQRFDVQRLAPAHCTGQAAFAQLWTTFRGRCGSGSVGTRWVFPR
jgi:7,8-dihydropterin-6-yl-methyl-4-(beta-D-ribofuranosyl)aminobenzene 5'-phosphate synthase